MNKKNIDAIYPLSPTQQGMLFETLFTPHSGIHLEQSIFTLQGDVNVLACEQAWQKIIARHSVLRTGFVWKEQEQPLQVVLRQVAVPLAQQDWREYSLLEQQAKLQAYLESDRDRSFNLSQPPLMRLALFQTDNHTYQLVWTSHHILMDGWCNPLLFQEFLSFYQSLSQGQDLQLKPVRPYKDYIAWLKQQDELQVIEFWQKNLKDFTKPTSLGITAEPINDSKNQAKYSEQEIYLNATTTEHLKFLAKSHRLTLNTIFQGIWALLLCRYSNENDIVFGITVSGRPANLPGIESTIGLFINTLPLRVKINSHEKLLHWLNKIQTYNLELRQYEHSNAGQVHQCSELPGHLPLYESLLVFENYPVDINALQSDELKINISDSHTIGAQTKYALTFLATVNSDLHLKCVYDKRRFDRADVKQILEHFLTLLNRIISDPAATLQTLLAQIPLEQIPKVRPLQKSAPVPEEQVVQIQRTPIEEVLAGIWTEILGKKCIGNHDNFFDLGGHSLLATQVISRLRDTFRIEIPLSYLFESPTIAECAQRIETKIRTGEELEIPPIKPISRSENLPLSFAQQRLWLLDQLHPDSHTYNDPTAVRLTGSLNITALEQSLNAVVNRHEILRTVFVTVAGEPVQKIQPITQITIPIVDLRGDERSPQQKEAEAQYLALKEAQRPFNLAQGPLIRATLLQLDKTEYVLLLTMHHIISDLWSMTILIQELADFYTAFSQGKSLTLPDLPIQYADFAVWQREWMQGKVLETQLNYWKQQLKNAPTKLELPTDKPRPLQPTYTGTIQSFQLSKDLSDALKLLSKREDVTLSMTLLTTFNVLLHYYTKQEDIVVGSPIANRNRSEIEGLIGFFVNSLALRTDLSGNPSFSELLRRTRKVSLGAYSHQDLPFEKLVAELQLERDLNSNPIFQVWFAFQNIATPDIQKLTLSLPELTLSPFEIDKQSSPFDLGLLLAEEAEGISGCFEYKTDLFASSTIIGMTEVLEMILQSVVTQPEIRLNQLVVKLHELNQEKQIVREQEYKNTIRQKLSQIKQKSHR
ncbi:condensation protein [Nostoc sp. FACHB-152]|uniref:condensation domain-containing protein n=1 Tax=unclassified Nostoc TaxID=2593658 RepID=UPI00168755FA|nr:MULTISPECIES: condensation domain-containing protein [unclassified Nostoc]MBD2448898.1 condensation protein [Nostoc sp. FACHB-152]MBD2472687.1 condensation protein [Nostoc sp. FACHB-145]